MFQPGELVICVNPGTYKDLEMGDTYTVKKVSSDGVFIYLKGVNGGFFPSRFKSASPKNVILSLEDML